MQRAPAGSSLGRIPEKSEVTTMSDKPVDAGISSQKAFVSRVHVPPDSGVTTRNEQSIIPSDDSKPL